LTDADVAKVKELGLTDMIDLRSSEERVIAPTRITGIRYSAINYSMLTMMGDRRALTNGCSLYHNFPAFLAPQLRIVFDDLIRTRGPIADNCSAGQDRTGFATAMVLSALGAPRSWKTITCQPAIVARKTSRRRSTTRQLRPALWLACLQACRRARWQKSRSRQWKLMACLILPGPSPKSIGAGVRLRPILKKEVGVTKGDLALLRATYLE
jgi:protein-tyrosine phosphatase